MVVVYALHPTFAFLALLSKKPMGAKRIPDIEFFILFGENSVIKMIHLASSCDPDETYLPAHLFPYR